MDEHRVSQQREKHDREKDRARRCPAGHTPAPSAALPGLGENLALIVRWRAQQARIGRLLDVVYFEAGEVIGRQRT